jgi:hypothetical protein
MTLFNNLGKINEKKISIKNSRKKGLEMFKNRESIKNNLND